MERRIGYIYIYIIGYSLQRVLGLLCWLHLVYRTIEHLRTENDIHATITSVAIRNDAAGVWFHFNAFELI